jgi:hypothetical protein
MDRVANKDARKYACRSGNLLVGATPRVYGAETYTKDPNPRATLRSNKLWQPLPTVYMGRWRVV